MITLRPTSVSEWPETSHYPGVHGGVLYITEQRSITRGPDGLVLNTPGGTSPLGIRVYNDLGFSLDAYAPDKLILCNTTEVWEVDLQAGHAQCVISSHMPLSCAIAIRQSILTLVSSPFAAVQRWERGADGVFAKAWETLVPAHFKKMSVIAEGRGLVLHQAAYQPSLILAVGPDGLRAVAGLDLELDQVRAEGERTLVVPRDAENGWWHAFEGIEASIVKALEGPPWATLRDVEIPMWVTVIGDDGEDADDNDGDPM
jgi:hypothetical protein